jgi:hyaluronan synthase
MIFRAVLWLKYRAEGWKDSEQLELPLVSVVIPAFNEEKSVFRAVEAMLASDYPQDKMELVCVNDGSTDSTWKILVELKKKHRKNIRLINLKKNQGKRKALYQGIRLARGEIIITTDADSQVHRRAIKNLILPLLKDSRLGAVAGKVAILNEKRNLITRMLAAQYALSFDFGRAYQSVYGGVLCCPGALSAFRRKTLTRVLNTWVRQKFLKVSCNHGEDRSLSNLILKKGYLIKYQANAVVYTRVPEKIIQVNRMYLRWTRSYIRESWLFARFMLLPRRKKYYLLPAVDFFFQLMLHPLHLMVIGLLSYSFLISPEFIFNQIVFLMVLAFALGLNNLKIQRNLRFLYSIPHAFFAFFFQWWLVPYATITVKDQSWLTK